MAGRRFVQLQRQVEQLQEELYRSETGKPFTSPPHYAVAFAFQLLLFIWCTSFDSLSGRTPC